MDQIGHYKIVSELGRGGMGVVYKAHEESLNRFVAIKMLGEHLEEDAEYVERFVREAQSAAALNHPNIVQIYSISQEGGHHYFVMEYVHGTSVQRMIQTRGKLPPADAARLILQAAAGLEDAHAQDVVHRDIKPANLMVTDRGMVKIADFGLALMGAATTRLTATGMLMGTPGYLSPEQCLDQSPDHRTDIYSLGVTFFEMVTGTMPFRADSPLALLKLIVEVEPPDICELNPEVDEELRSVIARMLAKDREDRYSGCGEIITDIQNWLESRGEPQHGVAGAAATGAAAGTMPPPPPPASKEDINTLPTVVVASGSTNPDPSPAAPPAPHDVASAPPPQATAPVSQTQPPAKRSHTGLIVAAITVFVLGAGAVAAVLTVKSGIFDTIFNRGETEVARLGETEDPSSPTIDASPIPSDSESPADPRGANEADADLDPTANGDRATTEESKFTESGEPVVAVGSSRKSSLAGGPSPPVPPADGADAAHQPPTSSSSPPPLQIAAIQPTATVVLAVGEQLLAVEAEEYVKARLRQAGVEIIEVTSIPGLEGFTNTESRPGPELVRAALRPHARYFVPLRVEYLGDRAITYMGQRDIVYQARVNMAVVDLATGRPLGRPNTIKVEYTQLNAGEVATRDLRRSTTAIIQKLPRE